MNSTADQTRAYVSNLDLPAHGPRFEAVEDDSQAPVLFGATPQAVVIGAQIAEFAAGVDGSTRSAVADSLLIAQLAANKAADSATNVMAWYRKYVDVLQNLGWVVGDMEFKEQTVSDTNAGVHTAIIPVVMSMLAPGSTALTMVLSVLDGLKEMDRNSKWITLFDKASQHARGAKFQFSHVDADSSGNPRISALCFGMLADHTVTQVLFFKFSQDHVSFESANGSLSMTTQQLDAVRDSIAARVRPFVVDFVQNLDI
ncbi:MAG: hypothetical protein EOP82_21565 [Variovorax sp.]|nr:MAG: hypothetical protein EOP82_21565 [Variovorax sp.]